MILNTKTCPSCGKGFTPKAKTRRYCYDCDVKTREALVRASKRESRQCLLCGGSFVARSKSSRFCRAGCRIKYFTRQTPARKPIECAECGTEFTPSSRVNKTCSGKCSTAHSVRVGKQSNSEVVCVICGGAFVPASKMHVCCSSECSDTRQRKARSKEILCVSCGSSFTHTTQGTPKRCVGCRSRPIVAASAPCDFCGAEFSHPVSEPHRFCSRVCSSKGIHAEGLGNTNEASEALESILSYIKSSTHTPGLHEICEECGYSRTWVSKTLGFSVADLYEKAGRPNRHNFASRFEEKVYYALLELGVSDADIERQKKFQGLYYKNKGAHLRFDFYIKSRNLLIEADGPQHEGRIQGGRYDFDYIKVCDQMKNDYATAHGVALVRLPYANTLRRVTKLVSQLLAPYISDGVSKAL